ncbi:unnamed protein product [Clonostachys rosea]|uniref:NADPH--cytochrome P450 reductase n=1 Tax=Bionectria ochroleuca TaxID=29856 RepID=A0ABY6V3N8_BIOOC|nr:unnamed protein product [Clonostachys rosea]
MDLLDAFYSFASWELWAILPVLLYLLRRTLWSRSSGSSKYSKSAASEQPQASDGDRDFVQKMEQDQKNCIIFYGSQTGTAEGYAGRLAKEGKTRYGLETMVANLEDYDMTKLDALPGDKVAFFVLASYGEGEPTDNAIDFYNHVTGEEPSFSQSGSLANLSYVAFGLGNKTYEHYNIVSRDVVKALDALGASRVGEVGQADDGAGTTEEDFLAWKDPMWTALASRMGLQESECAYEPTYIIIESEEYDLQAPGIYLGEPNDAHRSNNQVAKKGPFDTHNPYVAPITSSRELLEIGEMGNRSCIHLDIDIAGTGLSYETGDHLAVWPSNANQEVDRLLDVLDLSDKRNRIITIGCLDDGVKVPFPSPTTYDAMMRYYLEICAPISRQLLSDLVQFAPNDDLRDKVAQISDDKDLFHHETHHSNVARFLQRISNGVKWSTIPLSLLVESLPKLQHRFYSISSSPLAQPSSISITIAVKSERITGSKDQDPFCGVASNFLLALHRARSGQTGTAYDVAGPRGIYHGNHVPVHIRHSNFRLPKDPKTPIIMIGPGTGVAPFRGFVQERAEVFKQGREIGDMLLFFGCRESTQDFLYKDEWVEHQKTLGDKFEMVTAFSREYSEKVYVQHRLKELSKEVYFLLEKGACIYVCGDAARMAKDVNNVLIRVVAEGRGVEYSEAEEIVKGYRAANRYQEDVWA